MAVKKNTISTKKKTFVPDIVVDLTNCTDAVDVYTAFADVKIDKYLTPEEVNAFANDRLTINWTICNCEECCCKPVKKPNVFKRFWNWITRKK